VADPALPRLTQANDQSVIQAYLAAPKPGTMIHWDQIRETVEAAGPRRIRLLAAACCRAMGDAVPSVLRPLIDVAEAFADRAVPEQELCKARETAHRFLARRLWSGYGQIMLASKWQPCECVSTLLAEDAHMIALHGLRSALGSRRFDPIFHDVMMDQEHEAGLQVSADCVQLAAALYAGADCAFALHDALLEAGAAAMAEHFSAAASGGNAGRRHWKGCRAVDAVLGR
jgi:hypothetical protein